MDLEFNAMVHEVCFHLLTVDVIDVQVGDSQTSVPSFVAVGKIGILNIEHAVDEREVIFDLLVTFDVEADMTRRGLGFSDSCFEVRHVGC